jgi:hypothetical protein
VARARPCAWLAESETVRLMVSTSTTPKGSAFQARDLLAQQFILHTDRGHGFQSPFLVFDVRFLSLQANLAAGQEPITPFDQGGRCDSVFPRGALQVGTAKQFQDYRHVAFGDLIGGTGSGDDSGVSSVCLRPPSDAPESYFFAL